MMDEADTVGAVWRGHYGVSISDPRLADVSDDEMIHDLVVKRVRDQRIREAALSKPGQTSPHDLVRAADRDPEGHAAEMARLVAMPAARIPTKAPSQVPIPQPSQKSQKKVQV